MPVPRGGASNRGFNLTLLTDVARDFSSRTPRSDQSTHSSNTLHSQRLAYPLVAIPPLPSFVRFSGVAAAPGARRRRRRRRMRRDPDLNEIVSCARGIKARWWRKVGKRAITRLSFGRRFLIPPALTLISR